MYYTIASGKASEAIPQGHHHKRSEVGFELAIKRLPARCLDHWATTFHQYTYTPIPERPQSFDIEVLHFDIGYDIELCYQSL
jgi:hypothetical protein